MVSSDHIHPKLGKPLKKPYSIGTTNQELQENGTIGFIVKKVREDYMSDYLTTTIKVWDTVHLLWPAWHMTNNKAHENYLLISVGSGLSPMIGLYESIVAKQQFTKVSMLYWERYASHVLPSTKELFWKNISHTHTTIFLSREKDLRDELGENNIDKNKSDNKDVRYHNGYIQDGLEDALQFLDTTDVSVFICGKPEMVDDVRRILDEKWIIKESVKFEKY